MGKSVLKEPSSPLKKSDNYLSNCDNIGSRERHYSPAKIGIRPDKCPDSYAKILQKSKDLKEDTEKRYNTSIPRGHKRVNSLKFLSSNEKKYKELEFNPMQQSGENIQIIQDMDGYYVNNPNANQYFRGQPIIDVMHNIDQSLQKYNDMKNVSSHKKGFSGTKRQGAHNRTVSSGYTLVEPSYNDSMRGPVSKDQFNEMLNIYKPGYNSQGPPMPNQFAPSNIPYYYGQPFDPRYHPYYPNGNPMFDSMSVEPSNQQKPGNQHSESKKPNTNQNSSTKKKVGKSDFASTEG